MIKPDFDIKSARFEGHFEDGRNAIITENKHIWAENKDGTIEYEGEQKI